MAGNCLRSHVNLTETGYALSIFTKAGAEAKKLMVGVTSYGRSFEMITAKYTGPDCTFTRPDSGATPRRCTQTAGYIANAEIDEIISDNPTVQVLFDDDSDSDIIVYNNTQWVGYMTTTTKSTRTTYYKSLNMGGTTEWAVDIEKFLESADDISIVNLSTDLTDAEQCETPDPDEVTAAEASSERNVAGYIDSLITGTLQGETTNWSQAVFDDSNVKCSSYPINEDCNFPSSSACTSFSNPARYWAQFVIANFWAYMDKFGALFDLADNNVTKQILQLTTDFPVQAPDAIPDVASLLTNFAGVLSIEPSYGSDIADSVVGVAGGLMSEESSNLDSSDSETNSETILYSRSVAIATAFYDSVSLVLIDMFDTGDLSSWPSSLTSGDYTTDIANFFDSRFMFELTGTDEKGMESLLNEGLLATMAGTALVGANYFILRGAYTTSGCADVTSGIVIDGYCYTLEYPGDYGGTMSIDVALAVSTSLPTCFYNFPIFELEYTGADSIPGSPCQILTNNGTASTPEVGVTYMPSNLADIFTDDFCFCSGSNKECTDL
ncbi:Acidic mammalian chitinase [Penicillium subrubescens]|uniref:Acidic mammalian chitinase n=2 Tax=Penicillium subrubescens TaxID=1316194 RepID=A0A1Q5TCM0_9EURO|nr:Acidic mammalian chitinase [Penicillium subrubescens]